MNPRPRILILDDEDRYALLLQQLLPRYEYLSSCHRSGEAPCEDGQCALRHAHHWAEASEIVSHHGKPDLILLDIRFQLSADKLLPPGLPSSGEALREAQQTQGLLLLQKIRSTWGNIPVLLMTRFEELRVEDAAEALNASDYTYLAADAGLDIRALEHQINTILAQQSLPKSAFVWGQSPAMKKLSQQLSLLALGDRPVLLLGESGTGKSFFARHILHPASKRSGEFLLIDLATLPENLVSAELFGTTRGAFSGATDRAGAFENAQHGTLFLDEIGNLSLDIQRRLLTVLQEREVTRLGENRPRRVDVKICAATNVDLEEEVRQGRFRNDLYMRLNPAAKIVLPPLRERQEDIPMLLSALTERLFQEESSKQLLRHYAKVARVPITGVQLWRAGTPSPKASATVLRFVLPEKSEAELFSQPWLGNIRQLEMVFTNTLLQTLIDGALAQSELDPYDLPIRQKLLREQLQQSNLSPRTQTSGTYSVSLQTSESLHEVALSLESQVYEALFSDTEGDFYKMAKRLLGADDASAAKKVRIRFNQLGLRARGR